MSLPARFLFACAAGFLSWLPVTAISAADESSEAPDHRPRVADESPLPSPDEVRAAIARGLPYLEQGGTAWIKQRACMSCHHVPFLLWSHHAALDKGIAVDEQKLNGWDDWSANFSLGKRTWFQLPQTQTAELTKDGVSHETLEKLKPLIDKAYKSREEFYRDLDAALGPEPPSNIRAAIVKRATATKGNGGNDGGGLDTLWEMLVMRADYDHTQAVDASREKLVRFMAETPDWLTALASPNGYWSSAGQLLRQDRPNDESIAVTTKWTILALLTVEKRSAEAEAALQRGRTLVKDAKIGTSLESLLVSALLEHRLQQGDVPARIDAILARQNPDGGWAWKQDHPSDAYATGQALYVLNRLGRGRDPAIGRAWRYLLATQEESGGWPTTGVGISNANNDARRRAVEPIYRFWGSAWAVIGLADTLPDAKK